MNRTKLSILFLLSVVVFAPSAHAYLDPGTGSLIIQILIGFLAGLAFAFKSFWYKLFRRKKTPNDAKKE